MSDTASARELFDARVALLRETLRLQTMAVPVGLQWNDWCIEMVETYLRDISQPPGGPDTPCCRLAAGVETKAWQVEIASALLLSQSTRLVQKATHVLLYNTERDALDLEARRAAAMLNWLTKILYMLWRWTVVMTMHAPAAIQRAPLKAARLAAQRAWEEAEQSRRNASQARELMRLVRHDGGCLDSFETQIESQVHRHCAVISLITSAT